MQHVVIFIDEQHEVHTDTIVHTKLKFGLPGLIAVPVECLVDWLLAKNHTAISSQGVVLGDELLHE